MVAGAGAVLAAPRALFAEREIPVRIGATDWNLRQESKVEALDLGRRIGFDGVEVSLGVGGQQLPLADPLLQQRYRDEAKRLGIRIGGTCLNILHRNYLKSDPLGQKWVRDSIPITRALGARVILLPFFGRGALETRQEMDYVADFLREAGPEAERAGVVLGLENTCSARDNARILDRARSRAVRVYYDVGNSILRKYDIYEEIRWLGADRICQFHLKDNPRYLGMGIIDFPSVVDAIADIGFRGWAHLETDSPSGNVEADMGRNLRYIRGLFAQRAAAEADS